MATEEQDEGYIYELSDGSMSISLFAWEEDPTKLAILFQTDEVLDEDDEPTGEEIDFMITLDREGARQLVDIINRFFDGNFEPTMNGINIIEYANSLLKKPKSD